MKVEQNSEGTSAEPEPESSKVETLFYATGECILGRVLIARSHKGVCAILLGAADNELMAELADRFPDAKCTADRSALHDDLSKVEGFVATPADGIDLTLDIRGTTFQRRVWEKIRAIHVGRTVSYTELSRWISPLATPRSVAGACAANTIALAIPCHRVVRDDGDPGNYRWGAERKRAILTREATSRGFFPRGL